MAVCGRPRQYGGQLSKALLTLMAAQASGLGVGLMALNRLTPAGGDRRPSLRSRSLGVRVGLRLAAAGQVLQPNDSCRRNLPFVILRGDRPLHLLQWPLNSDGPHDVPSDSYPPRRPTFVDPKQPWMQVELPAAQRMAAGNRSSPQGCRAVCSLRRPAFAGRSLYDLDPNGRSRAPEGG